MKSGSWSSFQSALPIEARAGGEPDDGVGPNPAPAPTTLQALEQLLEWAEKANSRLKYETEGPLQFGGNPYLNQAFKNAHAAIAQAKVLGQQ